MAPKLNAALIHMIGWESANMKSTPGAEIEPEGNFHDGLDDSVNAVCLDTGREYYVEKS